MRKIVDVNQNHFHAFLNHFMVSNQPPACKKEKSNHVFLEAKDEQNAT